MGGVYGSHEGLHFARRAGAKFTVLWPSATSYAGAKFDSVCLCGFIDVAVSRGAFIGVLVRGAVRHVRCRALYSVGV